MPAKISLYAHGTTPNPCKVGILLEELGVEYDIIEKQMGNGPNGMKQPDYLKINPNGRVPAIIDHTNKDFIVWESGAILLYIAEKFDPSGKWAGKTLEEKAEVWTWLMYQVSGLGPMQGQANWFKYFHPVKDLDQSVYDRYTNETKRVYAVLEQRLEEPGREWIALDRFTIVDIAFFTWLKIASFAMIDLAEFPKLKQYTEKIAEFSSVKTTYDKLKH